MCSIRYTNALPASTATASKVRTAGSVQPRGPASVSAHVAAPRVSVPSAAPATSSRCRSRGVARSRAPATHGEHDDQHGDRHIEQECPPPPGTVDQPAADERADRAGDAAEPGPRADGLGAIVLAEAGLQDGEAAGREERRTDPLQHARGDEHLDGGRRASTGATRPRTRPSRSGTPSGGRTDRPAPHPAGSTTPARAGIR